MSKTSYTCSDSRCPKCGERMNGATDPLGSAVPTPGDLSVCVYCGNVLVFNHDMTVRDATRYDVQKLTPELAWKLGLYVGAVNLKLKRQRDGRH